MTTLDLLVFLLLVLVGCLVAGSLMYLTLRHPAVREPISIGLGAVAVLTALVGLIITR